MKIAQAKICGLTTSGQVATALNAGADYVGFMSFPPSPRHIEPKDARPLAVQASERAKIVSVLVDPSDALLTCVLDDLLPDYIQLHGSEPPEFCAALRARGVGVIKAFGIATATDLDQIPSYIGAIDMVLLDAKPPAEATRPGGLGHPFDWTILQAFDPAVPWFLSGGLTANNVALGVHVSGAKLVDVSSGVETIRGLKDDALMMAFMAALNTDT